MLIATFLVISQLPIEVSSFPLLGKSVITHFTKASLLFYSFLQASKDHMSSGMRNLRTLLSGRYNEIIRKKVQLSLTL